VLLFYRVLKPQELVEKYKLKDLFCYIEPRKDILYFPIKLLLLKDGQKYFFNGIYTREFFCLWTKLSSEDLLVIEQMK
jgi:hypothetical protein